MRVTRFFFVAFAILLSSLSRAQTPIRALGVISPEGFEFGTLVNNTYTSECLGFSIPIPPGMEITMKVSPGNPWWIAPPGMGVLPLLTMVRYMEQPKFGFESISVGVSPAKESAAAAEDFVVGLGEKQVINAKPQGELVRGAFAIDYGGKHFFRVDYKKPGNNGSGYMAFVYTKFRGYFIGETLGARTTDELEEAASSLEHISFLDDKPLPTCKISKDDSPKSTGTIGGATGAAPIVSPSNSDLPQRVRVSSGVSTGLLITRVQPQYPDEAREARIQGTVVLKALIDANGDVEDLTLVSGHPLLAPAAIEAVKQWKYRPYLLNGQPVKVETQVVVNFQLAAR